MYLKREKPLDDVIQEVRVLLFMPFIFLFSRVILFLIMILILQVGLLFEGHAEDLIDELAYYLRVREGQ